MEIVAVLPVPDAQVAFGLALAAGLYPFLLADLLKIVLASGMLPGMWRMMRS